MLSSVQLLPPHEPQPARLLQTWRFPGKNTGVGCHFLLQGIFLTQESNPGLLHCRQIFYQLSYKGSPSDACSRVLICISMILSRGTSFQCHQQVYYALTQEGPSKSEVRTRSILGYLYITSHGVAFSIGTSYHSREGKKKFPSQGKDMINPKRPV